MTEQRSEPFPTCPGFYIAWGRWLDCEFGPGRLFKVGHTGSLGDRLLDGAYTTGFPPDHWRYEATLELPRKEDAALLEAAVLACAKSRRLLPRELVAGTADEILDAARNLARALGLTPVERHRPTYEPRARAGSSSGSDDVPMGTPLPDEIIRKYALTVGGSVSTPSVADQGDIVSTPSVADQGDGDIVSTPSMGDQGDGDIVSTPSVADQGDIVSTPSAGDQDDPDELDLAGDLNAAQEDSYPVGLERREYQAEATRYCLRELQARGRAILQMACRCGKTPVAYDVVVARQEITPACGLFLVPGLALLRQTAQKLQRYGYAHPMLLVGSDARPVSLRGGAVGMTTDPSAIAEFVRRPGPRLVVSTYQSSPLIPPGEFSVIVFDECHRICGGAAPRPFNHVAMSRAGGARLYMTATPVMEPYEISMSDRGVFGGVAYRYYLRQGINAGYVNDFSLRLVAAPPAGGLTQQILAAIREVDKLLVFCRDTRSADELCRQVAAARPPEGLPFACLSAHSRMGGAAVAAALARFTAPGRAVMFNCRLFQEGVELPALNAIFFAAPRHSPRDIIQSLCRPLNSLEGKPPSVVFLPVHYDPASAADAPENLKRFATIVPFVDALLAEDPRLYEYLLGGPAADEYPIDILGVHTLRLDAAQRPALLQAVRQAVRYRASASARPVERLLRSEMIPWTRAYDEIRRVVLDCNRYPKTTDEWIVGEVRIGLHRFYRAAADNYAAWRRGEAGRLEPWQALQLEELPGWVPYGVEGPYPWRLCMDFLERWLAEHGTPPMVNINNGGYVGLEATMVERLSGCLTCINQQDGRAKAGQPPGSGFTVGGDKQADLDRICAQYGLRWRKARGADGALLEGDDAAPTFIQEAYARFKQYYAARGAAGYIAEWFPGFPLKHKRMENMTVQATGVAPLRRPHKPRRAASGAAQN